MFRPEQRAGASANGENLIAEKDAVVAEVADDDSDDPDALSVALIDERLGLTPF